jgi:hypothetical protein
MSMVMLDGRDRTHTPPALRSGGGSRLLLGLTSS